MGRAIEVIESEIKAIEERVKLLAEKLHQAETNYLKLLAKGVRQQLIMTAYRLCTQVYPDAFLQLSFSETEQLQQQLKKVVQELQKELTALEAGSSYALELSNPMELTAWQKMLEVSISNYLQVASASANQAIEKAGIFPANKPSNFIDTASKMEELGEATSPSESYAIASSPNLVNLMVENPEIPENGEPIVTSVQAIYLRLMDIEFNDSQIAGARHQIRHLVSQLANLQREYQQKQGERIVVAAENAWRRSWFDE